MRILVFSLAILAHSLFVLDGLRRVKLAGIGVHRLMQFWYEEQLKLHLIHIRHVLGKGEL